MKENTSNNKITLFYSPQTLFIHAIAFCGFLCLFSCKTKRPVAARKPVTDTTAAVKTVDPKIAKIAALKAAQISYNTFSGKAKTKLTINNDANDVTLNIRIQHDKKIWVSVTAIAGLEVARALITPDSIMLINRMQSLYIRQPFSYIGKYAGSNVNYRMLESVLVGNAIPEALDTRSDMQTANGGTSLAGNLSGLVYNVVFGADNRTNQVNLNDAGAEQSLTVNNSAFVQAGSRTMPSQIDLSSIVKGKKIQVNLRYTKQDFDLPLEFPFNIPPRYAPAQL